jgi:hypothetical protein
MRQRSLQEKNDSMRSPRRLLGGIWIHFFVLVEPFQVLQRDGVVAVDPRRTHGGSS